MKKLLLIVFALFLLNTCSFAEKVGDTIVLNKDVNIHKNYQNTQVIYKLKTGDSVKITEIKNNWLKISYQNKVSGWISYSAFSGSGLSPDQKTYLQNYVVTYVNTLNQNNWHLYKDDDLSDLKTGYDLIFTNGVKTKKDGTKIQYSNKIISVCSTFVGAMLHQTVGAPMWGETVNGVQYKDVQCRGTSFANPAYNGSEVFTKVNSNEYLEIGDALTYEGYHTHAGLYIGYVPSMNCHVIAQSSSGLSLTKISGTTGVTGQITLAQLNAATGKWACASRLKQEVLPNDWTMPSSVVINFR